MALTPQKQIRNLFSSAQAILILLPEDLTGDMLCSAYGLGLFTQSIGLDTTITFQNRAGIKEMYDFLPKSEKVSHSLSGTRDFVITLTTTRNDILSVKSERTDTTLNILVTPEKGNIDSRDLSFGLAKFPYDLVVSLGASTKQSFGKLGEEMPDLFYDVPIINIDHKSDNEHFGQVNLVSLTASSLSEVVADLCQEIVTTDISRDVAQCLLTGIITATDSFRDVHTTPGALSLASVLIDAGADQQEIVTQLYKSQPLSLVTLWGRALSKLEIHEDGLIVSTLISQEDFSATKTAPHILPLILDKIRKNHTTAKFFILIYENDASSVAKNKCVALIDAKRFTANDAPLPEEIFGKPTIDHIYELSFSDGECDNGRQKIAKLIHDFLKQD